MMKRNTSLTLTLAALRLAAATNSTYCSPRLISYWLNANATLDDVVPVGNGSNYTDAANLAYPVTVTNLPDLCAVSFTAKTADGNKTYKLGIFLPNDWNDDLLTVGNEGFDGGVNWPAMGAGVRYGFATVSTDGGHNSTTDDLAWALDDEDKRKDFGFRAIHGSVELARRVATMYYGLPVQKSYFAGTSDGGRQGLKVAQMYPRDFQGILVGAPTWWQSHLQSWRISRGIFNQPSANDTKILTAGNLTVAGDAVRKQCDLSDGIEDGIVSNPANCTVDWDLVTCGNDGVDETACLTPQQVNVTQTIYSDYTVNDTVLFPGLNPSSEYEWSSLLGEDEDDLNKVAVGYFRNFLFNDSDWDWETYNDTVPDYANQTNPGDLDVNDFNLTQFASLGHKIIMYHGLADGEVPTAASAHFYDFVVNATGGDVEATRGWFRLFFVPGLGHHNTSVDAPWYIGGPGQYEQLVGGGNATVAEFNNATYDALAALVLWETEGTAPESIIATTWANSTDPSTEVLRQRPICPYPAMQTYIGEGEESKPESFVC